MIECCFTPLLTLSRRQLTLSTFYLRFNSTGKGLKYLAQRYSYEKSKGSIEAQTQDLNVSSPSLYH